MHLVHAHRRTQLLHGPYHAYALVSRTGGRQVQFREPHGLLLLLNGLLLPPLCRGRVITDPRLLPETRLGGFLVRSHDRIHLLDHPPRVRILVVELVDGTVHVLSGDHLALVQRGDVRGFEGEPDGGLGDALVDGFPGAVWSIDLALALRHQQGLDCVERQHEVQRALAHARVPVIVYVINHGGRSDDVLSCQQCMEIHT
jgi:hypothetical protein